MIHNVKLIVCCDANYGIGYQNNLPWKIPEEMKLFQSKTIGNHNNCVIMGRQTYESIPTKYSPLKHRHNCVLSSRLNTSPQSNNVSIFSNPDSLIQWIKESKYESFWIIGGKQIYNLFLHDTRICVKEIHMSILDTIYECDTFLDINILDHYEKQETKRFEDSKFTHNVYIKKTVDCP